MEHIGIYLKNIFFQNKKGQLIFRHDDTQKYLFFKNGNLVFARTNRPEELLNEVLFRLGKISDEVYQNIDNYIEPQKSLGDVLVSQKLISERDLDLGLENQMREIVLNMFSDFEGEFKFDERSDFLNQSFKSKLSIPLLIEEGIRRMSDHPSVKNLLEKTRPFPKSKSFFYRLTDDERVMLDQVNGIEEPVEILNSHGYDSEKFWKSLYLFYCLDLVDLPDKKEEGAKSADEKDSGIGDKEKKIADVLAISENLSNMDYYQVLEVKSTASQTDIKKSYFRLAKKFHPDHFDRNLPHEIKRIVDEVFDAISKSYQTLSDEEKRTAYDAKPDTAAPSEDKRDAGKTAEIKFRQGKTLYDKGRYEEALGYLEEAIRLQGTKGRHFLLLALTQLKIPSLHRKSEENFLKAIELDPWNSEVYVGLGLLYRKVGLNVKAKRQFQKAESIDPDHKIAQRELHGADGKKRKGWKGILEGDLFKKKK